MMPKLALITLLLLGSFLLLGACDVLNAQPQPTAIFVTATPQQFVIVTNTPTPSASPVLAPTLPGEVSDNAEVSAERTTSPTPEASSTSAITLTPTFTPTPTDTPVTPGAIIGPVGGIAAAGIGDCTVLPDGGFGEIYQANPELAAEIGCPVGAAISANNAFQDYERGIMVWVSSVGASGQPGIYAIYDNGSYQRFNDTWVSGSDPDSVGLSPPPGLVEPVRGFGKVWRESPGVSDAIGWARSGEGGGSSSIQSFERGEMVYVPQNGQTYILVIGQPGRWTSIGQPF
jgi:hypothetical protein